MKRKFLSQGLQNGYDKQALNSAWAYIIDKNRYSDSKAHCVCYTWLAYQAAYLKAHYPDAFQKAVEMRAY
jgi:DNA polymerase-3 subunit alpha